MSCGSRRSSREQPEAELGQRVLELPADLRVTRPRRLESFVEQHAEARRAARTASRSARCGGSGGRCRRSRRSDRGRGTTTAAGAPRDFTRATARSEKLTGERPGGTPRHFCVPEYTASIPQASTSTGMPPSDVTVSTSSNVSVSLERGERRDLVLDAGRGLRVHDRDEPRAPDSRAARRAGAADRSRGPTARRRARPPRRTGARPRTCARRTRR